MSSSVKPSGRWVVVLAMLAIAAPSRGQDDLVSVNLSGSWKMVGAGGGDTVTLTHHQWLDAPAELSATYDPLHRCQFDVPITQLFDVPFTVVPISRQKLVSIPGLADSVIGNLSGRMTVCTGVKKLTTDCAIEEVYDVDFTAIVRANRIQGSYRADYVAYKEENGHWRCRPPKPGGGRQVDFTLERSSPYSPPPLHQKR